jgi:hypothetical protein
VSKRTILRVFIPFIFNYIIFRSPIQSNSSIHPFIHSSIYSLSTGGAGPVPEGQIGIGYEKAILFFFNENSPWLSSMIKRMSEGIDYLNRENNTLNCIDALAVTTDGKHLEIYKFIHILTAIHVYDVSPSVLLGNDNDLFCPVFMSFDRYMTLCRALCTAPQFERLSNATRFVCPANKIIPFRTAINSLCAKVRPLAMDYNTVTTLSFDDDKIHSRGKDAKDLDLESGYQRGGKAGPTLLAVVQNSTGCLVSAGLETYNNELKALMKHVTANAFDPDSDFNTVDMQGVVFALDRGLMKKEFILKVVGKGAHVLGTINNGRNGIPFKCVPILQHPPQTAPRETIHIISEEGARAAYWAKGTIRRGQQNNVIVWRLAFRTGTGKVIHLITTNQKHGPGNWVLEPNVKEKKILRFINEESHEVAPTIDEYQQPPSKRSRRADRKEDQEPAEMKALLNQQLICNFQSDAIWFLTRSFRITSSISAKVLNFCFKVRNNLGIGLGHDDTIVFIREMLSFPSYDPTLPELPDLSRLETKPRSCTLEDIKEAARARHITGFSSISWQDKDYEQLMRVVNALKNYVPNNDLSSTINKIFFQNWFLVKQSKKLSVKSMEAGTRNEPFVVGGLIDFLNNNNKVKEFQTRDLESACVYTVNPLYMRTCGLFVDKNHGFLATSVDGLMAFQFSLDTNVDFAQGQTLIAAVEIKTRTTVVTIRELIDRTDIIGVIAFCKIDNEDQESMRIFEDCIPLKADRQQVMLCCLIRPFYSTLD